MSGTEFKLGDFRLERKLGQGGMAEVWAATHTTFGGEAAVKVMTSRTAVAEHFRDGFVAEARSHAGLDHPHIVRLLDVGHVGDADTPPKGAARGDAYLVMELAQSTIRDDALPARWEQAREVLLHVLAGLGYSHARGTIHRDLKPENVLRFGAPHAPIYKLADFGIAHSVNLDETADRDTLSVTVGTPHYMAPEQFRGQWYEFGPATDLYAVGCLAFELVGGQVPYDQPSLVAIATAHLNAPIPRLEARFDVPEGFAGWVARLLQKEPRHRFHFAADAADALLTLSRGFQSTRAAPAVAHPSPALELDDAATLVDGLTALMLGDTLAADSAEILGAAFATAPQVQNLPAAQPAPFPESWRRERGEVAQGFGLGLLALRETPAIGFAHIRDQLWSILGRVIAEGGTRVVVLRGTEHAPVTALATWFARRVAETGSAVAHDTFYTRTGGPREGLVALLEDAFGTWPMADGEMATRVERFIPRWVRSEVAATCTEIATGMILAARGSNDKRGSVPSRAARHRAVAEVLESTAPERPHLCWITDVQWGIDAIAFAQELAARPGPGLVVLGVRGELPSRVAERLAALATHPATTVINVEEHRDDERVQLARAILPLTDSAATDIVRVTRGDEVVTRLLLDLLRDRDGLRAVEVGYELVDRSALPSTRADVCSQAIARCVARNPRCWDALMLAAVLGRAPDPSELADVCAQQGIQLPNLRTLLVEHGLAKAVGERWWFSHDGVVEVIAQSSRAQGRWAQHNAACAEVLLGRAGRNASDLLERAARHFLAAGQPASAIAPLAKAMREWVTDDLVRARELMAEYDELCDDLQLPADHNARLDGAIVRMFLLRIDGEIEASEQLGREILETAQTAGHRVAQGTVLRHLARITAARGSLDDAMALYARAEAVAAAAGERQEHAAAAEGVGHVYELLGDGGKAIEALHRAIDLYHAAGAYGAEVRAMSTLASVLANSGELDEAQTWAGRSMQLAVDSGAGASAEASNILGEIARQRADYDSARDHYHDARARFVFAAPLNVRIVDLNLAMIDLAQGAFARARTTLRGLRPDFERDGLVYMVAIVDACLCACSVADGDVKEVTNRLGGMAEILATTADPDVVAALEIAFQCAMGNGVAVRLVGAALAELLRRLGEVERAAEIDDLSQR